MNKREAAQILAVLKAAYPNSYRGMSKEEALGTVSVWAMQFADMPVDIVMMAVNKMISTSQFPPAVSEVKKKISAIHWEAWQQLNDGLRGKMLPPEEKAQLERIKNATEAYGMNSGIEPKVHDMLPGINRMLLQD